MAAAECGNMYAGVSLCRTCAIALSALHMQDDTPGVPEHVTQRWLCKSCGGNNDSTPGEGVHQAWDWDCSGDVCVQRLCMRAWHPWSRGREPTWRGAESSCTRMGAAWRHHCGPSSEGKSRAHLRSAVSAARCAPCTCIHSELCCLRPAAHADRVIAADSCGLSAENVLLQSCPEETFYTADKD